MRGDPLAMSPILAVREGPGASAGPLSAMGGEGQGEVGRTARRGDHIPHIRKVGVFAGSSGALSAAERPSAKARRVSAGSITPSSHSRALA